MKTEGMLVQVLRNWTAPAVMICKSAGGMVGAGRANARGQEHLAASMQVGMPEVVHLVCGHERPHI